MKPTKDYIFSTDVTSVRDFVGRLGFHKIPVSFYEVREPSGAIKYYEIGLDLKLVKYLVTNLDDCLMIAINHPEILAKFISYDEIVEG